MHAACETQVLYGIRIDIYVCSVLERAMCAVFSLYTSSYVRRTYY